MATSPSAMRTAALLRTKLFPPGWQPHFIPRPGLCDRLLRGSRLKVALVSAPPGFGKSTLLAEWLAAETRTVAWVSLDDGDNQPGAFWALLLLALAEARHGDIAATSTLAPGVEEFLEQVAANPSDIVLVLDDLHVITNSSVHEDLAFLVDHQPPNLHLVIASRADPPLPLSRLRARGELEEIRAADLRFAGDDIARFFKTSAGLELDTSSVAALERETEGWIAALKLAALSMRGRDDIARFIADFSGEDRYIVDFLVEEVLDRQPEETRTFLLQTSILDRLSAPVCDAVTGMATGRATLAALERNNLFLIPLDDRRRWYRYHHLFADVLRAHLAEELAGEVAELHRRASAWFEANGEQAEAIRHAFAAQDYELAARLVEAALPLMRSTRQEARTLEWLLRLPDEAVRGRPVLAVGFAGMLLSTNQPALAGARLDDAEVALAHALDGSVAPHPDTDPGALAGTPAWIALYRSALAQAAGDATRTQWFSRRAMELALPGDYALQGAATALLGLSRWGESDLDGAFDAFAAGMARLHQAGFITDVVGGSVALGELRMSQGRMDDAAAIFHSSLRIAEENGTPHLRGTADMHVGLAEIATERNDLDVAADHLAIARGLGDAAGFPQFKYRWRVAMARVLRARNDFATANDLLEEAERFYVSDFFPNTQPIPARRARLWIAQGRLPDAARWAHDAGISPSTPPGIVREFELLTYARLHIADVRASTGIDPALSPLLDQIVDDAHSGGREMATIDALIVQGLLREKLGNADGAEAIARACALAEPGGLARIFLEEGEPIRVLLRRAVAAPEGGRHAQTILAMLGSPGQPTARVQAAAPSAQPLAEPLTPRELEILRLVASGMQNQEIADHFVLSLATVKRHIANIYGKLQVGHRTAAIVRATDLGLI